MSRVVKSRAVIIAITEFHKRQGGNGESLEARKGVKYDTKRLHKVLSKLGFEVSLHTDVSSSDIRKIYQEESRKPQGDCFISIISSHGEEGIIYDFYGEPVLLRDLYNLFSPHNSPALSGIPKLFFIQACRGNKLDEGTSLETDGAPVDISAFSHIGFLPKDTVVMFASSEGYAAFNNPSGSFFLKTLCDLLSGSEKDLELTQLLTRLAYWVAYNFESKGKHGGCKEMPCYITNLTRELYPFRT
ncbi:caspase-7-like isoform X2 [Hyla sarda]|nr:caspase-7-like isoform X2 [Hyla sarda]XP_056425165.1 caspase-7-like isoform X2 [Hyla sarda]XP_056425166.1 caspase-7-like isoform X2 [Hyla sarda]XP_056425167.1 caspase-7-like isoform X2 [Hyla sarda]XP_056425169.1 caspase-7-like isoform X2 [Hyla sarda]XP_056425170.1 caspase-7-like isoform X2 [Hyla sarda]XP_056425171.1 caspase-7-like isoform X2 [Hyla sarda]XP_056425172.1 caspase-7-like isoform X2 [Hyla sarda]